MPTLLPILDGAVAVLPVAAVCAEVALFVAGVSAAEFEFEFELSAPYCWMMLMGTEAT